MFDMRGANKALYKPILCNFFYTPQSKTLLYFSVPPLPPAASQGFTCMSSLLTSSSSCSLSLWPLASLRPCRKVPPQVAAAAYTR